MESEADPNSEWPAASIGEEAKLCRRGARRQAETYATAIGPAAKSNKFG
jgi:hypothetical protein